MILLGVILGVGAFAFSIVYSYWFCDEHEIPMVTSEEGVIVF